MDKNQTKKEEFDPKVPLKSTRREFFVQNLLKGMNITQAYKSAGYRASGHSAETSASTLRKKHEVSARLEWLLTESATNAVATRTRLLEILSAIIRGESRTTIQTKNGPITIGPNFMQIIAACKQLSDLMGWAKQGNAAAVTGFHITRRIVDSNGRVLKEEDLSK